MFTAGADLFSGLRRRVGNLVYGNNKEENCDSTEYVPQTEIEMPKDPDNMPYFDINFDAMFESDEDDWFRTNSNRGPRKLAFDEFREEFYNFCLLAEPDVLLVPDCPVYGTVKLIAPGTYLVPRKLHCIFCQLADDAEKTYTATVTDESSSSSSCDCSCCESREYTTYRDEYNHIVRNHLEIGLDTGKTKLPCSMYVVYTKKTSTFFIDCCQVCSKSLFSVEEATNFTGLRAINWILVEYICKGTLKDSDFPKSVTIGNSEYEQWVVTPFWFCLLANPFPQQANNQFLEPVALQDY